MRKFVYTVCRYCTVLTGLFVFIGLWKVFVHSEHDHRNRINRMDQSSHTTVSSHFTTSPMTEPSLSSNSVHSKPKLIIVLGYQRVSSTFTGQLLNQNPRVFNIFEPVDGMYSDMYGTALGWNVPTDIAFHRNTSQRNMPEWEKAYITSSLNKIFSCNFSSGSMGMLTAKYWRSTSSHSKAKKFIECLDTSGIYKNYRKCRDHIKSHCESRFEDTLRLHKCRLELLKADSSSSSDKDFMQYQTCANKNKKLMKEKCAPLLENECLNSPIRSIKTVRLSMEVAGRVMASHDNVWIIHLIRDPKAVTLSRRGGTSYRGVASDLVSEAKMYCQAVLRDIQERKLIEKKFPQKVLQIFTDTFVQNTTNGTAELYNFLHEKVPKEVLQWVEKNSPPRNPTETYFPKWHKRMQYNTVYDIDKVCSKLYQAIQPPWPNTYKP